MMRKTLHKASFAIKPSSFLVITPRVLVYLFCLLHKFISTIKDKVNYKKKAEKGSV